MNMIYDDEQPNAEPGRTCPDSAKELFPKWLGENHPELFEEYHSFLELDVLPEDHEQNGQGIDAAFNQFMSEIWMPMMEAKYLDEYGSECYKDKLLTDLGLL